MIKYDLHVHSNYSSDATQSVDEIFQRASQEGIRYFAICDHDNIDSIPEAIKISKKYNMIYIPGVELSCSSDESTPLIPTNTGIHILGLNIRYDKNTFAKAYETMKIESKDRKHKLIQLLNKLGYEILLDEVQPLTTSKLRDVLVSKGYFADKKEAKAFLNGDSIINVLPKIRLKLKDAIDLIHELGGKAIWAHPYSGENKVFFSHEQVFQMMDYLYSLGIDGFEAFHLYTMDDCKAENILSYIKNYNLFYTIGSDRHHVDNRYGDQYYSFEEKLLPFKEEINNIEQIITERLLKYTDK